MFQPYVILTAHELESDRRNAAMLRPQMPVDTPTSPSLDLRWWFRSYRLMLHWEVANARLLIPFLIIVQVALYGGMIVSLGFLFEDIAPVHALYFVTGGTVMSMATVGLTFVPGIIAQRKVEGGHDYLWALPVPRVAMLLATLTVFTLVAVPGGVTALLIGVLRYDIALDVSPTIIATAALVLITTSSIGASIGYLASGPVVTNSIGNLLFIFMFLFSPMNYPVERLPDWLQDLHAWLPFAHMANAVRGSLTTGLGQDVPQSIAILGVWAFVAWLTMYWVLARAR